MGQETCRSAGCDRVEEARVSRTADPDMLFPSIRLTYSFICDPARVGPKLLHPSLCVLCSSLVSSCGTRLRNFQSPTPLPPPFCMVCVLFPCSVFQLLSAVSSLCQLVCRVGDLDVCLAQTSTRGCIVYDRHELSKHPRQVSSASHHCTSSC